MKVIVKRALHFRHPESRKEDLVLRASPDPQAAPSWIKDTAAFAHASKDGSIIEVISKADPKAKPAELPASTVTDLSDDSDDSNGLDSQSPKSAAKGKGKNGKGKAAGN